MSVEKLRNNPMMNRLLDALDEERDIGHYGRLVFTIVARHFLSDDELIERLCRDPDVDAAKAKGLLRQVEEADYSPPGPDTIRGYDEQQSFRILAHPDSPDAGNVYQDLTFPDDVYESIRAYHEQRAEA